MSAFQSKADVQEKEVKKFDGTGYDKDLVEALERDIISQNPNVKWYVFIRFCSSQLEALQEFRITYLQFIPASSLCSKLG